MENMDISKKGKCAWPMMIKLDQAAYTWFVQMRTENMLLSWLILCEKAAKLHMLLHDSELPFQASWG